MKITLSPVRQDVALRVTRSGAVLTMNGHDYDLAAGDDCPWIIGKPRQEKGVWHLTLMLPHGANAPHETLYPNGLVLNGDGPVDLPPFDSLLPDDAPPAEA